MAGTFPVAGNLSMSDLAATLTRKEQLDFLQLTGLASDQQATPPRNLATFVNNQSQLGSLSICASGATSTGTKILSVRAYISGRLTPIDVYRL